MKYTLVSLLLVLNFIGCTALKAGKAETANGMDTTVIVRPDGSRIEHTIQHDARKSDQGSATGLLKSANLQSGGGLAGSLGDFNAKLTASAGGNWLFGFLLIAAGGALVYFLKELWLGAGLVAAGAVVLWFPMDQILLALLGVGLLITACYFVRSRFKDIVAGVEEFKKTLTPEGEEILKDKLGKNQKSTVTEELVQSVKP